MTDQNRHDEPLHLYLSRGQAGVMAFFGCGIIFGGGLLTLVQSEKSVPLGWRIAVGVLSLYLIWVGAAYIMGAMRHRRQPVFTLTHDELVGNEGYEACRVALRDITAVEEREVRGVKLTVVSFEGGTVEIPHTLQGAEEATRRLKRMLRKSINAPA